MRDVPGSGAKRSAKSLRAMFLCKVTAHRYTSLYIDRLLLCAPAAARRAVRASAEIRSFVDKACCCRGRVLFAVCVS